MPIVLETSVVGVKELVSRLEGWGPRYQVYSELNLRTLGSLVGYLMRQKMAAKKYTGQMERSVSSEVTAGYQPRLVTGPTARHAPFVRFGTRPHWAPIAPLKRWAAWKLGDARLGYAVQAAIARRGTAGFDYVTMTVQDGRFGAALTNTARRLGMDLAAYIAGTGEGEQP